MKIKLHSQILSITTGYNPSRQIPTTQEYRSWSHGMRNVSLPQLKQWKILEHPPYSPDESIRLRSLLQSERTTARDPVQHKR